MPRFYHYQLKRVDFHNMKMNMQSTIKLDLFQGKVKSFKFIPKCFIFPMWLQKTQRNILIKSNVHLRINYYHPLDIP